MSAKSLWASTYQSPAALLYEKAVGTAISHLPSALRWVMILGEKNGLSTGEIADLAGVSCDVVRAMRGRGLALMQTEMGKPIPR